MDGAAQNAAARVTAAITDDLEYGGAADSVACRAAGRVPGRQCWYVLRHAEGTALWCARPARSQDASQNMCRDSADELAGAISAVMTGVVP